MRSTHFKNGKAAKIIIQPGLDYCSEKTGLV